MIPKYIQQKVMILISKWQRDVERKLEMQTRKKTMITEKFNRHTQLRIEIYSLYQKSLNQSPSPPPTETHK